MKFIHFGCWNYGKCNLTKPNNGMSKVMNKLINYTKEQKINFIIVAGDNYYPDKIKLNNMKYKTFNESNMKSGFECLLKTKIPTYILLGNHEFDTITDIDKNIKEECKVIKLQKKLSKEHLTLYKDVMHIKSNDTLMIMIDTNLYTLKTNIKCYDELKSNSTSNSEDKYSGSEERKLTSNSESNEGFSKLQLSMIRKQLKKVDKLINNQKKILIIGHEPICTSRSKKNKDKFEIHMEMIKYFFEPLLDKFKNKEIIYLCADTHLYQTGLININGNQIYQYIVGTGGAKLDDCPIETKYSFKHNKLTLTYSIDICKKTFGFLEYNNGTLSFIDVNKS